MEGELVIAFPALAIAILPGPVPGRGTYPFFLLLLSALSSFLLASHEWQAGRRPAGELDNCNYKLLTKRHEICFQ